MRFEVSVERTYPHPIDHVWRGLTTNESISDWLLETENFKAEVGHQFEMTCPGESGEIDVYKCQVLVLDPRNRMVWSWVLAGNEELGSTEVEFRLRSTETGTKVTLFHRGDRNPEMLERFKAGWPVKLDRLAEVLNRDTSSSTEKAD